MKEKKYRLGYSMAVLSTERANEYWWFKEQAELCEKIVLGIPDEWVMARLFGDSWKYNAEEERKFWLATGWFSDVIVLDAEHLNYKKIYEEIEFDACFYGSEYGNVFNEDKKFLEEHGVELFSNTRDSYQKIEGADALRVAIEDLQRRQKIVIFGTGTYFDVYMNDYAKRGKKYVPAYAIDNDSNKWNTEKNGIKIVKPEELLKENSSDVLIIICSKNYQEMIEQLEELGNYNFRTLCFRNDISLLEEFAITSAEERDYLEKSHFILETLMEEFDRVCRENKLHYYFICGSLIGVVRHKGMIPWDDDIDIAMPREDYKKLKKIAKKVWNNDIFKFLNYTDIGGGAFLDCMPRLFYMKEKLPTKCFDKVYGKATADIEDRMFIDIYVMDNAHENDLIHNIVIGAMKGIYNLMMGHRAFIDYDEYRVVIPEKTIKLMQILHSIGKIFPIRFLAFLYDMLARSGNYYKNAERYIMESCAIRCIELRYPKAPLGDGLRLPFGNIEVMVPSDYDAQLKSMRYNNYMQFPRLSVRKPSHYFNSDIEIW